MCLKTRHEVAKRLLDKGRLAKDTAIGRLKSQKVIDFVNCVQENLVLNCRPTPYRKAWQYDSTLDDGGRKTRSSQSSKNLFDGMKEGLETRRKQCAKLHERRNAFVVKEATKQMDKGLKFEDAERRAFNKFNAEHEEAVLGASPLPSYKTPYDLEEMNETERNKFLSLERQIKNASMLTGNPWIDPHILLEATMPSEVCIGEFNPCYHDNKDDYGVRNTKAVPVKATTAPISPNTWALAKNEADKKPLTVKKAEERGVNAV